MTSRKKKQIEDDIQDDITLVKLQLEEIAVKEAAEKKASKEKIDKLNADFTSLIDEVHQGSDEKWAEDVVKLFNSTDSNPTQASKSKKKGKTSAAQTSKSKEKGKAKPKQKSNSPRNNKKPEGTAPIMKSLASEKVQTTTKNDVEADWKKWQEVAGKKQQSLVRKDAEVYAKTIKPKDSIKSINVHYSIGKYQGGRLHEGTRTSPIFSDSRSFIEATSSQITNIRELVEMSSTSRYITTVDDLVDDPDRLPMLVTEPIVSVTSFFKVQADTFLKNLLDGGARSRWWAQISGMFRSIFGNVVHGLVYLHSMGHICGDLTNHIYVNAKGEGKILPLMDKKKSEGHYSQSDIEAFLGSFFPTMYVDLYAGLYLYRVNTNSEFTQSQLNKAFENWSSSYIAPKTLAASIYKGKQIFEQIGQLITKPVSSSMSRFSLSPSLRALSKCAKELGNRQICIPVKIEVMNQIQDLYFGKDEIVQLLQKDKLDATHISTYICLLYEDCVDDGLTKTFGFLCPSSISLSIETKDANAIQIDRAKRSRYIFDALHDDEASDGKLYLAPYNIKDHWISCMINPYASIVYYLDPLSNQGREVEPDLCNVVEMALRLYWNEQEKSITWKQMQCPQQKNMVDCGYFVLRFMQEVVNHRLIHIPDMYFADQSTYEQTQIDEVRDQLACHALRFYDDLERA